MSTQGVNLGLVRRTALQGEGVRQAPRMIKSNEVLANSTNEAGDVVGARLKFAGAGGVESCGRIVNFELTEEGAIAAQLNVYLYQGTAPADLAHDAAHVETDAEYGNRFGVIAIAAADWVTHESGKRTVNKTVDLPFNGYDVYARLQSVATPAYTASTIYGKITVVPVDQ